MKTETKDEVVPKGSGWEDRSGRFREDFIRRWAGFRIHSRPRGKPAVWEKEGVLYHEAIAYKVAMKRWEGSLCAGK